MGAEDNILLLMQQQGPLLPADAAKAIHTNILIASAHLSELASRKKVKISGLKVGGSPLYYLPGQESQLQEFSSNLEEKDAKMFETLRDKRIIRDVTADPLTRVSLRSIKDFAIPLTVTSSKGQEIFWKWYLTSDEEASELIRLELEPRTEVKIPADLQFQNQIQSDPVSHTPSIPPVVGQVANAVQQETKGFEAQEPIPSEHPSTELVPENIERPKRVTKRKVLKNDEFTPQLQQFFQQKNITITDEEIIRKDSEINYLVQLPSPLGNLTYLCKARNKKRSTEKDVSAALVEGQIKQLPIIYLHTGTLTAKAEELIKTNAFKTMVFYSIANGN
jgi:hypothetical protein